MTAYIIIILICLLFSAFFSATETAFASYSHTRIRTMAEDGNNKAKRVMELDNKFDKVLSTLLIGNNIVNILASSLATLLFIGWIKGDADTASMVSTIVMTIVVLIFGEITPKTIAKENPESFAMGVAPILKFFMLIFTPLTLLFGLWQKLMIKCFKKKEDDDLAEKELITIVEEAEEEGKIDEEESELICSAIEFDDIEAIEIFTPRVDVVGISIDATEKEIAKVFSESGYSRLPVYKGTIDNIVGILNQKDFYSKIYGTNKNFKTIIHQPVFVNPSIKVSDLLKLFQRVKSHIAIIADEFGGTAGIITMEDILEELVGEIWDEHDEIVKAIVEVNENEYVVLGTASIEDVMDKFDIKLNEDENDASMVGGWVIEELGKIPNEGDKFVYEGIEITVLKTEYRRIIEVGFKKLPEEENKDEE